MTMTMLERFLNICQFALALSHEGFIIIGITKHQECGIMETTFEIKSKNKIEEIWQPFDWFQVNKTKIPKEMFFFHVDAFIYCYCFLNLNYGTNLAIALRNRAENKVKHLFCKLASL